MPPTPRRGASSIESSKPMNSKGVFPHVLVVVVSVFMVFFRPSSIENTAMVILRIPDGLKLIRPGDQDLVAPYDELQP